MEALSFGLPVGGLIGGVCLGYIARRNFFCTLSALETHWFGNNSSGIRTWVLAAVFAAFLTQILVFSNTIDVSEAIYLTPNFGWLGAIIGGILFGIGMALIGTCSFGALVRLGGGSLKSLVAVMFLGLSALSAQRGLLGLTRTNFFDNFQWDLSFAGNQSIPSIISAWVGSDLKLLITIILIAIPTIWVFKDEKFRTSWNNIFTAFVIGAVCAFGWVVTGYVASESFDPIQIESASFVSPIGDTILQFTAFTGIGPDYGVGMVIGTVLGAAIAARLSDNVRWEACGDARELRRHILGACMMGFGGVLALGCTVGQGISAASLLTISVPITMISIAIGAKMGLSWLLEGSAFSAFQR